MKTIVDASLMKHYDNETIKGGTPAATLMRRAARAVVDCLWQEFPTGRVLFCCGGGNNGGDGLLAASLFAAEGGEALVYLTADRENMSPDCRREYDALPENVKILKSLDFTDVTAVVDALLGIGLSRPLTGAMLEAVRAINESRLPVLSVDIPTGVNADTGAIMGQAVRADATVAMAYPKMGHILYPGATLTGRLTVADIGVHATAPQGFLLEKEDLSLLPPRPARAHKGSFGRVLIIGGSPSMAGAAHLAAKAAYRAGAGLVEIFAPEENRIIHQTLLPEALLTCYTKENAVALLEARLAHADAVALGMGLSTTDTAKALVAKTLSKCAVPLVADADALNLIAGDKALFTLLAMKEAPTVLTPHPAEAARLAALPVPTVLADLIGTARLLAKNSGAVVALKDARTVITDGEAVFLNEKGNSGMATGGSGDVLAGVIAAFLGGKQPPLQAAALGVLAHALAGDAARDKCGSHGTMASDIIEGLTTVLF